MQTHLIGDLDNFVIRDPDGGPQRVVGLIRVWDDSVQAVVAAGQLAHDENRFAGRFSSRRFPNHIGSCDGGEPLGGHETDRNQAATLENVSSAKYVAHCSPRRLLTEL